MNRAKALKIGLVAVLGIGLAGCSSIRESRGYVVDASLVDRNDVHVVPRTANGIFYFVT